MHDLLAPHATRVSYHQPGPGTPRGAAGVACAVGSCGGGIADAATEQPRCPVLLHFGETDQSIPPERHGGDHEPSARLARRRPRD